MGKLSPREIKSHVLGSLRILLNLRTEARNPDTYATVLVYLVANLFPPLLATISPARLLINQVPVQYMVTV